MTKRSLTIHGCDMPAIKKCIGEIFACGRPFLHDQMYKIDMKSGETEAYDDERNVETMK